MNRFENSTRTDTLLIGGLLAVALAWLALSAVQLTPALDGHRNASPAAIAAAAMGPAAASASLAPRSGRAG